MIPRVILHVDLDAFFAAVEQLDNPTLRGKPVIVAGSTSHRGVVSTASYEARGYGVHSAQVLWKARELCPTAVVLTARMERYRDLSRRIFKTVKSYSPFFEQVSIDEAFLDITGCAHLHGNAQQTGQLLQEQIRTEFGLPCSVGIGPTKLVAKIASDLRKPSGLVLVTMQEQDLFLAELPIEKLPGIGKVMEGKLREMGISTVRGLRGLTRSCLRRYFGKNGEQLYSRARGLDNTPVSPRLTRKSVGSEVTFHRNLSQHKLLEKTLHKLCADVAHKLWHEQLWANTIELKVRFSDFVTITRSCTLSRPMRSLEDLWEQARLLLRRRVDLSGRSVRLLGVSVSKLDHSQQLQLFASPDDESLSEALADLEARFGPNCVRRGIHGFSQSQ